MIEFIGGESVVDVIKAIFDTVEKMEGIDPVVLDMRDTPMPTDYFLIVTANSDVHMKSLRDRIVQFIKKETDLEIIYYDKGEGYDWMIIDAGDVVIHIFTEKGREFYDLEGLWIDAKRLTFTV